MEFFKISIYLSSYLYIYICFKTKFFDKTLRAKKGQQTGNVVNDIQQDPIL